MTSNVQKPFCLEGINAGRGLFDLQTMSIMLVNLFTISSNGTREQDCVYITCIVHICTSLVMIIGTSWHFFNRYGLERKCVL